MLSKLKSIREEREEAFTLIELLVVILIIGILAAIAIPVFLNQRQTANDASVESDVKNAALQLESWVVGQKGANAPLPATVLADSEVKVSSGVTLTVSGTNNDYCILGSHSNGKQYKDATPATYDSAAGGFKRTGGACEVGMKIVNGTPLLASGAVAPNSSGITETGVTQPSASGPNQGGMNPMDPNQGGMNQGGMNQGGMTEGGSGFDPNAVYPTTGTATVTSGYTDSSGTPGSIEIAMSKDNGTLNVSYTSTSAINGQPMWEVKNLVCYPDAYDPSGVRYGSAYFMPNFSGTQASESVDLNMNGLCNVKSFTLVGTPYSGQGYTTTGTYDVSF